MLSSIHTKRGGEILNKKELEKTIGPSCELQPNKITNVQ